MAGSGFFGGELVASAWFDEIITPEGWMGEEFLTIPTDTGAIAASASSILGISAGALAKITAKGALSGAVGITASASARVPTRASTSGSLLISGASTAKAVVRARGSASVGIAAAASGGIRTRASVSGALGIAASAIGAIRTRGLLAAALAIALRASAGRARLPNPWRNLASVEPRLRSSPGDAKIRAAVRGSVPRSRR